MDNEKEATSLEDVINTAIDTKLKDIHTVMPGQIIKFDPATQLADVQPQIKRNINGKLVNLPVLSAVPVRYMKSKGFNISFPLIAGDEVAIHVIERSIDNWLEKGGLQATNDIRLFHLSDAFIVPVLYSQANKITNFDPANLVIQNEAGTAKVTIKPDGSVEISSSTKTTVVGNLDVTGDVTVAGKISAPDVVADNVEATTSLLAGTAEVVGHVHLGVTPGGGQTAPLA